jgi:hypothetical protein
MNVDIRQGFYSSQFGGPPLSNMSLVSSANEELLHIQKSDPFEMNVDIRQRFYRFLFWEIYPSHCISKSGPFEKG